MSEFLFIYGLFIAKVVTGLIALMFVMAIVAGSRKKEQGPELKVTSLNLKYQELKNTIEQALLNKKEFKQLNKQRQKELKKKNKPRRQITSNQSYLF